jgi:hypothetical protein
LWGARPEHHSEADGQANGSPDDDTRGGEGGHPVPTAADRQMDDGDQGRIPRRQQRAEGQPYQRQSQGPDHGAAPCANFRRVGSVVGDLADVLVPSRTDPIDGLCKRAHDNISI